MRLRILALAALASTLSARDVRAEDEPPDVGEILKKVDALLFFPDAQQGLVRYECDVSATTSTSLGSTGKMEPDPTKAKAIAHVVVDAKAGTKTWTGAGKPVIPGTFTPFCGPWTLTNVMRVEVELFLTPLSKRFTAERFERAVETDGDDFKLSFTPTSPLGQGKPEPLNPTVTRIDLTVTPTFAVSGGTLGVNQEVSQDDAPFECRFESHGGLQRISTIKTSLSSFNLAVSPTLAFEYAPQSGLALLKSVRFDVAGGQLSPTLGRMPFGGNMASALLYDKFVVTGEPAKTK